MSLFPIFLKLKGGSCLVVGAGMVGEGKTRGLLETGATIQVVAPQATASVRRWVRDGSIIWHPRAYDSADLAGVFLVVVATSSRELNDQVFREAQQRGVLCNVVDDPPRCDFYYPSLVRRGELQIAISTGGHSPFLAQRLRQQFESQFGPEYAEWVEWLGKVRERLFQRKMEPERRRQLLRRLASHERFEAFVRRRTARVWAEVATGMQR